VQALVAAGSLVGERGAYRLAAPIETLASKPSQLLSVSETFLPIRVLRFLLPGTRPPVTG
jgi:hypothetical protein